MTTVRPLIDRFNEAIPAGSSTGSKAPKLLPQEPSAIARGAGCRVWDVTGREFIDYRNALGPISLGYCFPAVDAAISAQLRNGIIFGHPHLLECEAAELFCELVPGAEQARFLKTGGEALAAVIRLARGHTGRDHVVQIGYNGWVNSLAGGARVLPGTTVERPSGVPMALSELHHQVEWNDTDALDALFARIGEQVAAVVVAADYAEMAAGATFYPYLRELVDRNGALLVYDEIVTGFRLAVGGTQEYFGVVPDLSVFAKGIANGMPLSVYTGRRDILRQIDDGSVVISSTLGGETLSLAAAIATMSTFRDQDVVGHLWRQGENLWGSVQQMFERHHIPLSVSGLPPCPTFVAHPDRPDALPAFFRCAYAAGVSLYNVSYVNFSHSDADIAETIERLERACVEFGGAAEGDS